MFEEQVWVQIRECGSGPLDGEGSIYPMEGCPNKCDPPEFSGAPWLEYFAPSLCYW